MQRARVMRPASSPLVFEQEQRGLSPEQVALLVGGSIAAVAIGGLIYYLATTPPPAAAKMSVRIIANPTSGPPPLTVSFDADVSGGTAPYSYSWDFGDGGTSTARATTHTYSQAGTYTVKLVVTDSTGAQGSDSIQIQVTTAPAPTPGSLTLQASKTQALVNEPITFSGSYLDVYGKGIPNATLYFFVNNSNVKSVTTDANGNFNFTYAFPSPGTYTVFIADNPQGT